LKETNKTCVEVADCKTFRMHIQRSCNHKNTGVRYFFRTYVLFWTPSFISVIINNPIRTSQRTVNLKDQPVNAVYVENHTELTNSLCRMQSYIILKGSGTCSYHCAVNIYVVIFCTDVVMIVLRCRNSCYRYMATVTCCRILLIAFEVGHSIVLLASSFNVRAPLPWNCLQLPHFGSLLQNKMNSHTSDCNKLHCRLESHVFPLGCDCFAWVGSTCAWCSGWVAAQRQTVLTGVCAVFLSSSEQMPG
jgi:hypothetical protein